MCLKHVLFVVILNEGMRGFKIKFTVNLKEIALRVFFKYNFWILVKIKTKT